MNSADKLFIELYLDEDVSVLIADLVRARGFRVTTTVAEGKLGASDREQLEFAHSHKFVLLTHNRVHFENLAKQCFSEGRIHSGIIIAALRLPYDIAGRLLNILNDITAEEMVGQLRYI